MIPHAKTVWFVFWVLSLAAGVVSASGVIGHEAWQKLVMGMAGVLGSVSTFLAAQWQKPEKVEKEAPAVPPSAVAVLLIAGFASGCGCWTEAKRNDPGCIVARQAIDCSVSAAQQVGPFALAAIKQIIAGGGGADQIVSLLANFGAADALCIAQAVVNDFIKSPMGPTDPRVAMMHKAIDQIMADHKISRPLSYTWGHAP